MGAAAGLFFSANDSEKQTLHRRIMPTQDQFDSQTLRWNELADHLLADLRSSSGYSVRSWLQGSYKFGTQVRPPSKWEEFDIDLGVYFEWVGTPGEGRFDPGELQTLVQVSLKKYAENKDEIRQVLSPPKKRCCRVHYEDNFHIDVPCYHLDPSDDERNLATKDGWEESDPKALYLWFKERFDDIDRGKIRRQIRYLKTWAGLTWALDGGRPSSVLLTVLASDAALGVSLDQPDDELLLALLKAIDTRLSISTSVPNPVDPTEDLNRLTDAQTTDFANGVSSFLSVARRAVQASDEDIAAVIWSEAFKHLFPMPDGDETGAAPSVGSGARALVPIQIPDVAVVAINKKNPTLRFKGLNRIGPIPKDCRIEFQVLDDWKLPAGSTIEWIVRNDGGEAEAENDLGHVNGFGVRMTERSAYNGTHFMDVIFRTAANGILGVRRIPVTIADTPVPVRNPPRPRWVRLRGRR